MLRMFKRRRCSASTSAMRSKLGPDSVHYLSAQEAGARADAARWPSSDCIAQARSHWAALAAHARPAGGGPLHDLQAHAPLFGCACPWEAGPALISNPHCPGRRLTSRAEPLREETRPWSCLLSSSESAGEGARRKEGAVYSGGTKVAESSSGHRINHQDGPRVQIAQVWKWAIYQSPAVVDHILP